MLHRETINNLSLSEDWQLWLQIVLFLIILIHNTIFISIMCCIFQIRVLSSVLHAVGRFASPEALLGTNEAIAVVKDVLHPVTASQCLFLNKRRLVSSNIPYFLVSSAMISIMGM